MSTKSKDLYSRLTRTRIEKSIQRFYEMAFDDPIIGHLFLNTERETLIQKQIFFACTMLGGPESYKGKDLRSAHAHLKLKRAHFGRRQVLMKEALEQCEIEDDLAKAWLALEAKLQSVVLHRRI